ncbi:MAG: cyclic-di-AMP receptor, partial [Clostridia bacterium]|nr:cyclic-di-AMP receptor [Clostridia bacterium]
MKLIIAIIGSSDAPSLSSALIEAKFSVTKLATTGGFLKQGNTTLLMGVDNERVEEALEIIKKYSGVRTELQP